MISDEALAFSPLIHSFFSFAVISMGVDRRIVGWNEAAERLFGYAAAEVMGKDASLIFTPEDRQAGAPDQEIAQVREFGVAADDRWHLRKDDSVFWSAGEMTPVRTGDSISGFVKVIRDRTDTQRASTALAERNRLLGLANFIVRDLDDRVTFWSGGAEDNFGYSASEALGRTSHDLLKTVMPAPLEAIRAQLFATGQWQGELIHHHKDGRQLTSVSRWVLSRNDAGVALSILEVNADVTERRRLEGERERYLAKLESLLTNSPVGIGFLDTDLRYLRVNPALAELNGVPIEAHIGRTVMEVLGDRGKPAASLLQEILQTGQPTFDREVSVEEKDGRTRHVVCNFFPVKTHEGSLLGVGGLVWDITDRKVAEKRLLDQAEKLWQTNRDLEHFAYAASHDLQGPLRSIGGFAALARTKNDDGEREKVNDFLGRIEQLSARLHLLIADLLSYTKINHDQEANFTDVNLNDVLRAVLADLEAQIKDSRAKIMLTNLPTIHANRTQLHQLFQNLLGNAMKYRGAEAPVIEIGVTRSDNHWVFSVSDNGIGIPPDSREKVFEVFTRLHGKGKYEGTGLGLAICRRIVERHFGRIWVEPDVKKGATFKFTLPDHTPGQ